MAKKTNFEVNGRKYFRVTRTIGKKSNGKPIRKSFYGSGINEANEKADAYMHNIKNGLINNYEYYTVTDLMNTWLFDFLYNSSKLKPSSFQRYEGVYRTYIKESEIAGIKICDCNIIKFQKYFNRLSSNHTYSQLKYLKNVLKMFFNWCIDNNYILKNPCLKIDIKGNKTNIINNTKNKKLEILTESEIKKIKKYIKGSKNELLFLLDMATGLRLGELLALDWNNINLNKKNLRIERSVKEVYVYDENDSRHIETIFQVPKTLSSIRTVPIPASLVRRLNKITVKEGLLFHDENNQPLKGKNVSYAWKKILQKCDISHKKFHSIRHTYASMLLKNGVDIQTVAELMGHTTITITQIYLHSSDEQKYSAVEKINYLFKN